MTKNPNTKGQHTRLVHQLEAQGHIIIKSHWDSPEYWSITALSKYTGREFVVGPVIR